MKAFHIRITMADGSCGEHDGLYCDGCSAVIAALDAFPDARRVSALRTSA